MSLIERLETVQSRVNIKLDYAREMLDLFNSAPFSGTAKDRAIEEAYLFHLIGAYQAFFTELNIYYETGLDNSKVSPGKLRTKLILDNKNLTEVSELHNLRDDKSSWFAMAKELRDNSTHFSAILHSFYMLAGSSSSSNAVRLVNPFTTEIIDERDVSILLEEWFAKMDSSLVSVENHDFQLLS